jgi:hypothetical protein
MTLGAFAEEAEDVYTETLELTFPLNAGGELSLSNKNGSLDISTWAQNEIHIIAEKRMELNGGGWWLARLIGLKSSVNTDEEAKKIFSELAIDTKGDESRREVETRYPESTSGLSLSVAYRITVPRSATVRADLTNGAIHIENVEGLVDAQSVNGAVALESVKGAVQARSTNGRVTIEDVSGNVVARTTNGSVSVELADGPVGDVELRSVNGSVSLEAPEGSGFALEIQTVHGSATCDLPMSVVDEKSRKELRGRVGEGGGSVSLETTNGSASVRRG